jgi:thioredoxin-like negative regulator of GroEL
MHRMAMVEQHVPHAWAEPARVPPHTYPLWVVLAAVLTLLAALYSFTRVPTLVAADRNLRSGQAALARHDYTTAVAQLERAHEESPSSRKATIFLATAEFGANQSQAALALLQGMRFTQSEWSTLTQTMPPSVQALFSPTN